MATKTHRGSKLQPRTPTPANKILLTGQVIARSPALDKPYRVWDAKQPGLFVRIQPSGKRIFYVQFARNQQMPLGRFPAFTVEQARRAAQKALGEAVDHGAPLRVQEQRERRQRAAGERIDTLGELMQHRYEPWVIAERKAGAATVQNIKTQFGGWYGRKFSELTPWSLERFKADRLNAGLLPATVNRDLVRIKAVLNKAVEWGLLSSNPLGKVKPAKVEADGRVRFLSDAEERLLRDALSAREDRRCSARESGNRWRADRSEPLLPVWHAEQYTDHLAPLVLLAINTGARRGELFGLSWVDVDTDRRLVTVRAATSKGNRTRHIPLNAEATAVLSRWQAQRDPESNYVFPGAGGGRMTNVNKAWAELMRAAALLNFRFHDLRHHFASRLVMAGIDLNTTRELLGHSDLAMTLRYAHLAPEHKAAAVAALDQPRTAGRGR